MESFLQKIPGNHTLDLNYLQTYPGELQEVYEGIYQDLYDHAGFVNPSNWPEKKSLLLVYGCDVPIDRFLMGLLKEDYMPVKESGGRFQALSEGNRPFTQSSMRSFGFGNSISRERMSESASLITGRRDKQVTLARGLGKTIQYIPYTTNTQIISGMLGFMGIPYFEFPLIFRNNHSTLLRNHFEKAGGEKCSTLDITEVETYMLKKDLLMGIGSSSWDRHALEKYMKGESIIGQWRLIPSHFLPYI